MGELAAAHLGAKIVLRCYTLLSVAGAVGMYWNSLQEYEDRRKAPGKPRGAAWNFGAALGWVAMAIMSLGLLSFVVGGSVEVRQKVREVLPEPVARLLYEPVKPSQGGSKVEKAPITGTRVNPQAKPRPE